MNTNDSSNNATDSPLLGRGKASKDQQPKELQPTLFIGLGGTGMEVLLRIRRRILHAAWGKERNVRLGSMNEFPVAEFIHFDLDQGAVLESSRAADTDPLVDLVKLPPQDRLVSKLDLVPYLGSDDSILSHEHIASWFPLTRDKVKDFSSLEDGAGQVRGFSRLYFYDSYRSVRDTIQAKLSSLKNNLTHDESLRRLGLTVESGVRVYVVASVAGGTGSGSFLDMGWLARHLARQEFSTSSHSVQLCLFTPRGYTMDNKQRPEANGYAAFMELESCMRKMSDYVGQWAATEDRPTLADEPYNEVYILESGNMAGDSLGGIDDVYEMVADTLFENFSSQEFANLKRMIAVNKVQHKILPYIPNMPHGFKDMKLTYHMGYSSFGQSILETEYAQMQERDDQQCMADMLQVFFGINSEGGMAIKATDKDRDDFIKSRLGIVDEVVNAFPDFGSNKPRECSAFTDYSLARDMLMDGANLVEAIQKRVKDAIETIECSSDDVSELGRLALEKIEQLERDVIQNVNASANTSEHRIARRKSIVVSELKPKIREMLYKYLDDRDKGGLAFVLSLVEMVKTRFVEIAEQLRGNEKRYAAIRDAVNNQMLAERRAELLKATKWTASLKKIIDRDKADRVFEHLRKDIGDYLSYHLRSVAARNAAETLAELSTYIGGATGRDDPQGNPIYAGLLEEFYSGRRNVLELCNELLKTKNTIADSIDKTHAGYIVVPVEYAGPNTTRRADLRPEAEAALQADYDASSRKIFPLLKTPEGRTAILTRLRQKAAELRTRGQVPVEEQEDPLFEALFAMDPVPRKAILVPFLRRAMPWIDTNFSEVDLDKFGDRFTCIIGVHDKQKWETHLLKEFEEYVPKEAKMRPGSIQFLSTGRPGRAVCYCEFSGFPLTVLRGLVNWRQSYRSEKSLPLHTHIDDTRFVHPMPPTAEELKGTAQDFRLFMLGVMLRKVVRSTELVQPPGLYRMEYAQADWRILGNERKFRRDRISTYRGKLEEVVNDTLSVLDPCQLFALSLLAKYYANQTYEPQLVLVNLEEVPKPGFAHDTAKRLAEELAEMARGRAQALGINEEQLALLELQTSDKLANWGGSWLDKNKCFDVWSEIIPDSYLDAFEWERKAPAVSGGLDRCKRRVLLNFVKPGWLQELVGPVGGCGSGRGGGIKSLPLNGPWWFGIGGVEDGPFEDEAVRQMVAQGKVDAGTMAWREGLADWESAGKMEELAHLFRKGPPPLAKKGPPPLKK